MNRRFAWLGALVGALAVWRYLRHRRRRVHAPAFDEPDPADSLRARLAESRSLVDEREEFEAGETPVDQADPQARRRDVHEQARAKLDELRGEEPPV